MIPYMVGKLASKSSHLTRGLVKYVPGRDYFRAIPSKNGDKFVTSRPPRSLNGSLSGSPQSLLEWDSLHSPLCSLLSPLALLPVNRQRGMASGDLWCVEVHSGLGLKK